jgi:uracil-DNA glycosylase family 4
LLYTTLLNTGFATGQYQIDGLDDLALQDCMITNAVRCAPPGNKPLPTEEAACRPYLAARIAALPQLKVIITLGDVARRNVLKALGAKPNSAPPGHGSQGQVGAYRLFNSYHCSRLNTNTGRLTPKMFEAVFLDAKAHLNRQ